MENGVQSLSSLMNRLTRNIPISAARVQPTGCASRAAFGVHRVCVHQFLVHPSMSNGVSMSYSFTEKKRIRKSFASRPSVLEVPSLLDTQLRSYEEFLQADVAPNKRNTEYGLQAAFTSIFPITSHNGYARLRFVDYELAEPEFDVAECQLRGLIGGPRSPRARHGRPPAAQSPLRRHQT